MNKQLELLNVVESQKKLELQIKALEINKLLNTTAPYDNIKDLEMSIACYTNIQSELQTVQKIKDQILKSREENED